MGAQKFKILVVDDDRLVRELLQTVLQEAGFIVDAAADGVGALQKVSSGNFDLYSYGHPIK